MLKLGFSVPDLAQTRLSCSALGEVVLSLRVLKEPQRQAVHLPWVRSVRARLHESAVDLSLLSALVPVDDRTPDFVTPPPAGAAPDLDAELGQLRAVPAGQVRRDLDAMAGPLAPALLPLHADPASGLDRLARQVSGYWDAAIAPHWPRLRALLEADIAYRAQHLAAGGARRVFRDLHPDVDWRDDTLFVSHRPYHHTRSARERGLLLVPSVFAWPTVFTQTAAPWQPTLSYPARGTARLWERQDVPAPAALAKVLGRSRARLLAELDAPATTTDLARRTGITSGGVSQHLTALRAAGMVTAHRDRRFVRYSRTPLGDALLAAPDPRAS